MYVFTMVVATNHHWTMVTDHFSKTMEREASFQEVWTPSKLRMVVPAWRSGCAHKALGVGLLFAVWPNIIRGLLIWISHGSIDKTVIVGL